VQSSSRGGSDRTVLSRSAHCPAIATHPVPQDMIQFLSSRIFLEAIPFNRVSSLENEKMHYIPVSESICALDDMSSHCRQLYSGEGVQSLSGHCTVASKLRCLHLTMVEE